MKYPVRPLAQQIAQSLLDTPLDRPPQTFVEEVAHALWTTPLDEQMTVEDMLTSLSRRSTAPGNPSIGTTDTN